MGLPSKQRTSRSKRERSSHFALKSKDMGKCEHCGAITLPHQACKKCGYYRGRQVIAVEKRAARLKRSKKGTGK